MRAKNDCSQSVKFEEGLVPAVNRTPQLNWNFAISSLKFSLFG